MIKKSFLILLLFCVSLQAQQLNLSVYAEVSIVTVGPGEHLYEAFGHTTIRVKDPVLQLDIAYNYGVFDYNAPNFYANFTKGKLVYKYDEKGNIKNEEEYDYVDKFGKKKYELIKVTEYKYKFR